MTAFGFLPGLKDCCFCVKKPGVGCVLIIFFCLFCDDFFANETFMTNFKCVSFRSNRHGHGNRPNNENYHNRSVRRQTFIELTRVLTGVVVGFCLMLGLQTKEKLAFQIWIIVTFIIIVAHLLFTLFNCFFNFIYVIALIINLVITLYFILVVNGAAE